MHLLLSVLAALASRGEAVLGDEAREQCSQLVRLELLNRKPGSGLG